MNRREILIAACAAPVLAMPLSALASSRRITWLSGTLDSPHALLAGRQIHQLINDGIIYTKGQAYIDYSVKLTDPTFVVASSDIMFHPTRGFRFEPSLEIEVHEKGVLIGRSRMYSNGDYEAYWGKPKPADRPDYAFRAIHTPYERHPSSDLRIRDAEWNVVEERANWCVVTFPELKAALGPEHVGYDMRWLDAWAKHRSGQEQAA